MGRTRKCEATGCIKFAKHSTCGVYRFCIAHMRTNGLVPRDSRRLTRGVVRAIEHPVVHRDRRADFMVAGALEYDSAGPVAPAAADHGCFAASPAVNRQQQLQSNHVAVGDNTHAAPWPQHGARRDSSCFTGDETTGTEDGVGPSGSICHQRFVCSRIPSSIQQCSGVSRSSGRHLQPQSYHSAPGMESAGWDPHAPAAAGPVWSAATGHLAALPAARMSHGGSAASSSSAACMMDLAAGLLRIAAAGGSSTGHLDHLAKVGGTGRDRNADALACSAASPTTLSTSMHLLRQSSSGSGPHFLRQASDACPSGAASPVGHVASGLQQAVLRLLQEAGSASGVNGVETFLNQPSSKVASVASAAGNSSRLQPGGTKRPRSSSGTELSELVGDYMLMQQGPPSKLLKLLQSMSASGPEQSVHSPPPQQQHRTHWGSSTSSRCSGDASQLTADGMTLPAQLHQSVWRSASSASASIIELADVLKLLRANEAAKPSSSSGTPAAGHPQQPPNKGKAASVVGSGSDVPLPAGADATVGQLPPLLPPQQRPRHPSITPATRQGSNPLFDAIVSDVLLQPVLRPGPTQQVYPLPTEAPEHHAAAAEAAGAASQTVRMQQCNSDASQPSSAMARCDESGSCCARPPQQQAVARADHAALEDAVDGTSGGGPVSQVVLNLSQTTALQKQQQQQQQLQLHLAAGAQQVPSLVVMSSLSASSEACPAVPAAVATTQQAQQAATADCHDMPKVAASQVQPVACLVDTAAQLGSSNGMTDVQQQPAPSGRHSSSSEESCHEPGGIDLLLQQGDRTKVAASSVVPRCIIGQQGAAGQRHVYQRLLLHVLQNLNAM